MNRPPPLPWLQDPVYPLNEATCHLALQRQMQLTKPPGSLGLLETAAIQLAAMQHTAMPSADRVHITIFAADHGIASEGVSAFPQAVTGEMIRNFSRGGAAISVLAKAIGATLEVVNLGTVNDVEALPGVIHRRLGSGTANFLHAPAMTEQQLSAALTAGFDAIERAQQHSVDIFIGGEMGIGNTTSATALACALLNRDSQALTGSGTGLTAAQIAHKAAVIAQALSYHRPQIDSPLDALRRLGGFEIAALTGAYLRGAQIGLPLLIDGFISSVAALAAESIVPGCKDWFIFSHRSAEPGHRIVLQAFDATPLLAIEMRLGEASGAATALPLLRLACNLHNGMATFAEAQVSGQQFAE